MMMENKVTKEQVTEAIRQAAIKQGKHPRQVIWEMKLKLQRGKEKLVREKQKKGRGSFNCWEYKIKELDQCHFEIEYSYYGYFGKIQNTIVHSANIILPKSGFYIGNHFTQLEHLFSDDFNTWIWQTLRLTKISESYKENIVKRLTNSLDSFNYCIKNLRSEHQNNISFKLKDKVNLCSNYLEIKELDNITYRSDIFLRSNKSRKNKIVQEEVLTNIASHISNFLIDKAISEFEKIKNNELAYKFQETLSRIEQEGSLWPLFPEEEQNYLSKEQKSQYLKKSIPADEEYYFRNVFLKRKAIKLSYSELPKDKFLLLSEAILGSIDALKIINGRPVPVKESFLCYEYTKIDCLSGRAMHAYSLSENFKIQLVEDHVTKEYNAFGTLLFFFKDKLESSYISSIRNYEQINEYWNFQIGSFSDNNIRKRFVAKYNSWWNFKCEILDSFNDNKLLGEDVDVAIEFHFPKNIDSIPIWNNRVTFLQLSKCGTKLLPVADELQNHKCWLTNLYYFKSGTLVHMHSNDLVINNKIIYDVNELKQTLLGKIREDINFKKILERLQEKDTRKNLLPKNPIFSVELARKALTSVPEFDKEYSFEKNQRNFLHVENKIYFLELLLNDLYNKDLSVYTKDHQVHQFVISRTKESDNQEFGRLAEKEVYTYLLTNFDKYNWSCKFSVPVEFFSAFKLEIDWHNQHSESFLPYDISIRSRLYDIKIDVKATRGGEENIFYVSIPELKKVLENSDSYLIARVSIIEDGKKMLGIRLNSEMNLNFFRFKNETIELIKSNLAEWENYYGEKSVRFLTSHFDQKIPITTDDFDLSEKFEEYQKSCIALISSYFEALVNKIIVSLFIQIEKYSVITEDPSLLKDFENNKIDVINQLCRVYGSQIRADKMEKPK